MTYEIAGTNYLEHEQVELDDAPRLALAALALEPAREHVADLVEELVLQLVHQRERARPAEQLRAPAIDTFLV